MGVLEDSEAFIGHSKEFVEMIREKLWLRDKGMLTKKAKLRKGIKEKLKRARPKIDNPKELSKILERTNVRHAMLMASERLYGNILRWFKKGVDQ